MPRLFTKRRPKVGAKPGTIVLAAGSVPPHISVLRRDTDVVVRRTVSSVHEIAAELEAPGVVWVDVQGLGDERVLRDLVELFQLHPLALEDITNVPQRPKAVEYPGYQLYISRMVQLLDDKTLDIEQMTIFFTRKFVLTFQERYGDMLDPVRARLTESHANGHTGGHGNGLGLQADYLAYSIIDTIIDGYYPVLEVFGEYLEQLEEAVVNEPQMSLVTSINHAKSQLLLLRRGIWPQREAVSQLIRDESPFVSDEVKTYLRTCYEHTVQVADVLETYREISGNLLSIYLSVVSNRTNEVMRVLTVVSTIFIPLTFLAGVYGMNFDQMPELHARYGYPILMSVMGALAVGMLWYFWEIGWIGSSASDDD